MHGRENKPKSLRGKIGSKVVKDQIEAIVTLMIDHGLFCEQAIAEFEKEFITTVLNKNRGNQTKAAKAMGIHRNTLRNKIDKLNIQRKGDEHSILGKGRCLVTRAGTIGGRVPI